MVVLEEMQCPAQLQIEVFHLNVDWTCTSNGVTIQEVQLVIQVQQALSSSCCHYPVREHRVQ